MRYGFCKGCYGCIIPCFEDDIDEFLEDSRELMDELAKLEKEQDGKENNTNDD